MTGVCALCKKTGELLGSHFLPAALYRNLSDIGGKIQNPILSDGETASEESRQVKQPLLCQDCEIRFQQGGESWTLARRLMPDGSFPLRDILKRHQARCSKNGVHFYELTNIPEIVPEQLLYFAASIFWRAAATDWTTPLGLYKKLQIPADIVELLREFLMGASFPPSLAILLMISANSRPIQTITLPEQNIQVTGWLQYEFYIPGMIFTLTSGNPGLLKVSLSTPPYGVAIDPSVDRRIEKAGRDHAARSTPTDKLRKKLSDA